MKLMYIQNDGHWTRYNYSSICLFVIFRKNLTLPGICDEVINKMCFNKDDNMEDIPCIPLMDNQERYRFRSLNQCLRQFPKRLVLLSLIAC